MPNPNFSVRPILTLVFAVNCAVLCGCISRQIIIESKPSKATLIFDGRRIGQTPQTIPFNHYGSHEILLLRDHANQEEQSVRFHSMRKIIDVSPPWYQYFPIDMLAEFLWPFPVVDEHRFVIELQSFETISDSELESFVVQARAAGVELDPDFVPISPGNSPTEAP